MTAAFDLARLVAPCEPEQFFREHWEQRPLVVRRNDPGYFADLLTLADVDRILTTTDLRPPLVRAVREGRELPLGGGFANALRTERLFAHFRAGATLALQFLHERHEPLARLCRALATELSASFQVNVYLTPPNEQGLATHYDTHDVFVLQLSGTKRWRLYDETVRLPLPGQAYGTRPAAAGEPVAELDLAPGDTIYLPRGFGHDAVATAETSLHLTVGVVPVTWAFVLLAAVEQAIEDEPLLRAALPVGFVRDRDAAQARLGELLDVLRERIDVPATIDNAVQTAVQGAGASLGGHLLDLQGAGTLGLDTRVRRRPDVVWDLRVDDDVRLSFHGKSVTLPAHAEADVRYVTEVDELTARDLPGPLDESGRLVLVRRLLVEGFLTLCREPYLA